MKRLTSISKKEYEHLLAIRNIPIHHKEFENTILIALFDIGNKSITEAYRSYVENGNLSVDEISGKKRLEDVVLCRVKMELDSNGK